ncbi:MAG: bifunctional hydroxymethylpyrimidine kinase/phosphomethylpyrimidine kinase [Anaerocolumna sp.]
MVKKVLTIAGSDCSGGAGIQADMKTITAHKQYAMSVITALTAQNTTGVYGIENVSKGFVENQMDCIFGDIRPDAVKIGMVSSKDIIESVAEKLMQYKAENVVVDPVMVSTSGSKLLDDNAVCALITKLIPLATLITPNISEAEVLSGCEIKTKEDMIEAGKKIYSLNHVPVLIKGGHIGEDAADLLYGESLLYWFSTKRIKNQNTHGTGCTLSSAIACNLAQGHELVEAIDQAKLYLTGAIRAGLDLGKGRGPLDHTYNINNTNFIQNKFLY